MGCMQSHSQEAVAPKDTAPKDTSSAPDAASKDGVTYCATTSADTAATRDQNATALRERTAQMTIADCDRLSQQSPCDEAVFLSAHRCYKPQGSDTFLCVPTTAAMLLEFAGRKGDECQPHALFNLAHGRPAEQKLSEEDLHTPTPYRPMQDCLEGIGVEVDWGGPWALDEAGFSEGLQVIKTRLCEGEPTIVDVSGLYQHSHTCLCIGYGPGVVYLLDAAYASSQDAPVWKLSLVDFRDIWTGAFYEPPGDFRPHMLTTTKK